MLLVWVILAFTWISPQAYGDDRSFFKTFHPAPLPTTESTLQFWEIDHANPALIQGKRYGRVFQSAPISCSDKIAIMFQDSRFLKQFRLEIKPANLGPGDPENTESVQLVIRSTPIISNWTVLDWTLPERLQNQPLVLTIDNVGPYHPLSEFRFSDPFDPLQSSMEAGLHAIKQQTQQHAKKYGSFLSAAMAVFKLIGYGLLWILPGMVLLSAIPSFGKVFRRHPLSVFPALLIVLSLICYVVFAIAIVARPITWPLLLTLHATALLLLGRPSITNRIQRDFIGNPEFRTSVMLWLLAAGLGLFAGMMFGGWHDIEYTATVRYLESSLPADNQLPGIFVERLYQNLPLSPYFHGWLSSDRPPLQSALILLVRCFFQQATNDTQLFSILLQSLCIPAVYLLLRSIGILQKTSVAIALSMLFTSSFFLNSLFVWPKLLPFTYLLLTTALLYQPESLIGNKKPHLRAILLGITSALSLLSHGGSIFGLLPMFLTAMFLWKLPHPRQWVSMILPFFLLMIPWMLYQKLLDPPGDRLVRWHIAGFTGTSDLGFVDLLISQYKALGWDQWIFNKTQNLKAIRGDWSVAFLHFFPYQFSNHFHLLRSGMFLSFMMSQLFQLPFIALFPLTLLRKKNRKLALRTSYLLILSLIGLLVWTVMMFSPARTILHQGTYYLPYCFILFFVSLVATSHRKLANILWSLQVAGVSIVWVLPALPGQWADDWFINQIHFDGVALVGYLMLTALSLNLMLKRDSVEKDSPITESRTAGEHAF